MESRSKKFATALIVISTLLATPSAATNVPRFANDTEQSDFIRQAIIKRFPDDYDIMLAIAYCETRSRPFIHWLEDGSLRPHDAGASTASGIYQVLVGYHKEAIDEMGLDMSNLDDYLTFVERLKNESPNYGAWDESRSCWESRIGSGKK